MKRNGKKVLNVGMILAVAMLWQTKVKGTEKISPTELNGNFIEVKKEGTDIKYKAYTDKTKTKLDISKTINTGDIIYGGYDISRNNSNTNTNEINVILPKDNVDFSILGGDSGNGTANDNKITITANNITGNIDGGYSSSGGSANGNKVIITTNEVDSNISSGTASGWEGGDANNNVLVITANNIYESNDGRGSIQGGHSNQGIANDNKVTITANNIYRYIYGGSTNGNQSEASRNIVKIRGTNLISTEVNGGSSQIANDNKVEIIGLDKDKFTVVTGKIFGGEGIQQATGNQITISKNIDLSAAKLGNTYNYQEFTSGWDYIISADKINNGIKGNVLNIGTETDAWNGGKENLIGDLANIGEIKFNTVNWDPNKAALKINSETNLAATKINASNINFKGKTDLLKVGKTMILVDISDRTRKEGRIKEENLSKNNKYKVGTAFEGEGILEFKDEKKLDVIYKIKTKAKTEEALAKEKEEKEKPVEPPKTDKIEKIAFETEYVEDKNLEAGKKVVVTEGVAGEKVNGKAKKPAVNKVVKVGTKATVKKDKIKTPNGKELEVTITTEHKLNTKTGEITNEKPKKSLVWADATLVKATKKSKTEKPKEEKPKEEKPSEKPKTEKPAEKPKIEKPVEPELTAREQTHNVMIGNISSLVTVNAGEEFIETGIEKTSKNKGTTIYLDNGMANEKYKTGSYTRTKVRNGAVGLGHNNGALSTMAFVEYGSGDYKANSEVGEGKGEAKYIGGAVAGRYETRDGLYTEASVRLGKVENDAKDILADGAGKTYDYKTKSRYFGTHLGLGKITKLSEITSIDTYGKYVYTNIAKDSFKINNEEYKLDAVNSSILKLGAEMKHNLSNTFGLYYGLAYNYEFAGRARGKVEGLKIRKADISGSSLMAELGLKGKPSKESSWGFDLGVKGYTGTHRGYKVNLGVMYEF